MILSPIAYKSAVEAQKRIAAGEVVKHSGRRRTEYRRPSVATLIQKCGSIQALGRLRSGLAYGAAAGNVNPSERTEREWERLFWKRVLELILSCKEDSPESPTFIYNHCLRWMKPAGVQEAIEAATEAVTAELPSQAETLRRKGIIIEGVTKP